MVPETSAFRVVLAGGRVDVDFAQPREVGRRRRLGLADLDLDMAELGGHQFAQVGQQRSNSS